jgi:hypothetical protein
VETIVFVHPGKLLAVDSTPSGHAKILAAAPWRL